MNIIRFDIISAVPETFDSVINSSILKIAKEKDIAEYNVINLHDYSSDKWGHIDDIPYGGGAGMIIKCEPVFNCIEKLKKERNYDEIIYLTPDGEKLNQTISNELSLKSNIMLLCGHYKGIDFRIREKLITREISIGDFVLSGGELPALVLIDSVVRLLPGVIGDAQSALEDSFMNNLIEAPIYTRPSDFRGQKVPEVLLNGNHALIQQWKEQKSLEMTKLKRPDLLKD